MRVRFLVPSLVAAGFCSAEEVHATVQSTAMDESDTGSQPLIEQLRLEHKYNLAAHRSHSSHGSHGSHQSHRSSGGTTTTPLITPPSDTDTSRNKQSTPESTVLPSSPAIAPILPGNSQKFRQVITQVQLGLTAYGYYTGTVDGVMGPQTKVAISKFQSAWGLPVTGTVTPEVLNALGIVAQ